MERTGMDPVTVEERSSSPPLTVKRVTACRRRNVTARGVRDGMVYRGIAARSMEVQRE
jgi:hypothetical protein